MPDGSVFSQPDAVPLEPISEAEAIPSELDNVVDGGRVGAVGDGEQKEEDGDAEMSAFF